MLPAYVSNMPSCHKTRTDRGDHGFYYSPKSVLIIKQLHDLLFSGHCRLINSGIVIMGLGFNISNFL